jgi:hypothetical protein
MVELKAIRAALERYAPPPANDALKAREARERDGVPSKTGS